MRWCRGTGRTLDSTTSIGWGRISASHLPSSKMLGTVADRQMKRIVAGAKIRDSSQTEPRSRSSR